MPPGFPGYPRCGAVGHGDKAGGPQLQRRYRQHTEGKVPEDELYLVIGSDMFLSFCQWYKFQYLLENCVLTVLSREEDDRQELECFKTELEEKYGAKVLLFEP
ncbi:MAG: hypothetical protein V8T45_12260 [Oscillospiraceae bacterium]